MDKLVKHGIRMLEIVEGENDFFRNDAERQADIAQAVYDTILRVQALERKADRKDVPRTDCPHCGSYECPRNDKDEPQTYITEDRDTQILDAWQVHHRSTTSVEDEPQTERRE